MPDADRADAEKLLPDRGELALELVARGHEGLAAAGGVGVGRRQRAPVELAAGRERHRREDDEGRRHHVLGQPALEVARQRAGLGSAAGARDDVGDEPHVLGALADGDDRCLRHRRVLLEHELDLGELDAYAAELDLEVGPPQVLERAVRQPARQVSGAVQARARRSRHRIGHEAIGGEPRPAEIAAPDRHAADVELSGDAGGDELEVGVEETDDGAGDGAADRDRAPPLAGHAGVVRDVDRRLGGAVEVLQGRARQPLEAALGEIDAERLAAAHDAPERRAAPEPGLVEKHAQHGRHEVRRGHALGGDAVDEVGRVLVAAGHGDHESRPDDERPEELPDRDVEAGRCLLEDDVGFAQPVGLLHPQQAVRHRAVLVHRPLRTPGAAGGEDDVSEVLRRRQPGWTRVGTPVQRPPASVLVVVEHRDLGRRGGQSIAEPLLDDHDRGRRVLEHGRQPLRRVRRIERHVGAARLERRQQRHDHRRRALEADADPRSGPYRQRAQPVRELVGATIELAIAERAPGEADRRRVGRAIDLGLDERVDAGVRRRGRRRAVAPIEDGAPLGR